MAAVKDLVGRLAELMVGRERGWRKKDGRHGGCVQVLVHCFWKGDGSNMWEVGCWTMSLDVLWAKPSEWLRKPDRWRRSREA